MKLSQMLQTAKAVLLNCNVSSLMDLQALIQVVWYSNVMQIAWILLY